MSDQIEKVVNEIIENANKANWARVDRLQLVLNELVKLEIAAISRPPKTN